jgi:hypothetical protein
VRSAQTFISADAAREEAFMLEERRWSSDSGRSSDAGGDAAFLLPPHAPPLPRALGQQHAPAQLRGALAQQHAYGLAAAASRPAALGFALAQQRGLGPAVAATLHLGAAPPLSLAMPPAPPPSAPHEHYRTRLCASFVRAPRARLPHGAQHIPLCTHPLCGAWGRCPSVAPHVRRL